MNIKTQDMRRLQIEFSPFEHVIKCCIVEILLRERLVIPASLCEYGHLHIHMSRTFSTPFSDDNITYYCSDGLLLCLPVTMVMTTCNYGYQENIQHLEQQETLPYAKSHKNLIRFGKIL